MDCNMGLKVGFVELIAKKTMEQPTMNQNEHEEHQHSNPLQQNTSHN